MNKRVLFVSMNFYEYDAAIKKSIENLGYQVDVFQDELKKNLLTRVLNRLTGYNQIAIKRTAIYQNDFLNNAFANEISYDIVFVIVGRYLSSDFFNTLRKHNSKTKFILYLWDDVARVENFHLLQHNYDVILSMDKLDCKKYGFKFLPLFYLPEFIVNDTSQKDILVFIAGLDHSGRVDFIKKLIKNNPERKKDMYFHIYCGRYTRFIERIRNFDFTKKQEFINYTKLPLHKSIELTKRAKGIIDIQYSSQNGLTLRTFEALAAKCKIVTTNQAIKEYDFFDNNNILIIDRSVDELDLTFFERPFVEVSNDILYKYSIHNWILTIFNSLLG